MGQKVRKNFEFFTISRLYFISQRSEKSVISPLSNCRKCLDPSVTGFYRVSQKVSDVIPVLRLTPIATEPSTVCFSQRLQVQSRICGTDLRTFWHWAIQVGQGVGHRVGKNIRKKSNCISATVISRYGKMLYLAPIQLSHVYGPIAHRVLQGGPKSKWRNSSFGDYEPSTVSVFLSVVKCGHVCRAQTYAHSGIEPSRLAKGFLQGGPKNPLKIRIFYHLQILRISTTVKNRGIWSKSGKNPSTSPIHLSHLHCVPKNTWPCFWW